MAEPQTLELSFSADQLVRRLLSLDPAFNLALLDSCEMSVTGGRFLIAGVSPLEVLTDRGGVVHRDRELGKVLPSGILSLLDRNLGDRYANGNNFRWSGGCIATFSYEFGRRFELPRTSDRNRAGNEIDAEFAFYPAFVVHDYDTGKSFVAGADNAELIAIRDLIHEANEFAEDDGLTSEELVSNFTRAEYEAAVTTIKEYIAAGDIYQANLTQQFTADVGDVSPEGIFLRLRREHPAPFAAFIRRSNDVVISGSPERFLRVCNEGDGRTVEAWPIKGTRPRGADGPEDMALRDELLLSEKDRAENVMIVDLLRNDIGRVAEFGSVEVEELFSLQEHPSLFHLVSKVKGMLRPETGIKELMRATFPCGSITGAPKIRAMEIINELETLPRGLSMGAIGCFGFDGTADLSVAIRTMTIRDGVARFNVGGGIVADSDPAAEYDESLVKARSLITALGF